MEELFEVSDSDFDEYVSSYETPSLVFFIAPWQKEQHREILESLLEMAEEYKGKINFFIMNAEANTHIVSRFKIRTLPTILVCLDGEELLQISGDINIPELRLKLDDIVSENNPNVDSFQKMPGIKPDKKNH